MAALFWKAVKVTLNGDLQVPGVLCSTRGTVCHKIIQNYKAEICHSLCGVEMLHNQRIVTALLYIVKMS